MIFLLRSCSDNSSDNSLRLKLIETLILSLSLLGRFLTKSSVLLALSSYFLLAEEQ